METLTATDIFTVAVCLYLAVAGITALWYRMAT